MNQTVADEILLQIHLFYYLCPHPHAWFVVLACFVSSPGVRHRHDCVGGVWVPVSYPWHGHNCQEFNSLHICFFLNPPTMCQLLKLSENVPSFPIFSIVHENIRRIRKWLPPQEQVILMIDECILCFPPKSLPSISLRLLRNREKILMDD